MMTMPSVAAAARHVPPRSRGSVSELRVLLTLLASSVGCEVDATTLHPSPTGSVDVAPALPPPQGHIIQIVTQLALDDEHRVWALEDGAYVPDDLESKPRQLLGWPAMVMRDGSVQCEAHYSSGMNPKALRGLGWVGDESDGDDGFLSFKVGHKFAAGEGEYVEARGADQILWGCFRRGTTVYRSGWDYGCPLSIRVVRTRTEPDLPVEVPGKPGEIGDCWDPVEQPIEAAQLFPGCLALDTQGVLHLLHVLRPPVELDRGVRFAMTLEDRRIVIVRDDGSATIQDGNGSGNYAPSPDPLPAGPPTPIELSPVRALFPGGVIFEDGTAAMFWSAEQLLRPLTGFSGPVELAGGSREICVRTEARTLHCHHRLSPFEGRNPETAPLVLEPAVFDASRDRLDRAR